MLDKFGREIFFDVAQKALDVGREVHDRHTKDLCITCGKNATKPPDKICTPCFGKAEDVGMRATWHVLKKLIE
jgi:ribosomal protein L37E